MGSVERRVCLRLCRRQGDTRSWQLPSDNARPWVGSGPEASRPRRRRSHGSDEKAATKPLGQGIFFLAFCPDLASISAMSRAASALDRICCLRARLGPGVAVAPQTRPPHIRSPDLTRRRRFHS